MMGRMASGHAFLIVAGCRGKTEEVTVSDVSGDEQVG